MSRIVFVLSTERSGSTLLSVLLGAHSRIVAPPELHLLRAATYRDWRLSQPEAIASLGFAARALGLGDDVAAMDARFGSETSEAVLDALARRLPPGGWLVDKTPSYAREETALARAERLRPFYVWLVRHPLAVARSLAARRRERRRQQNALLGGARLRYPLYLARERALRGRRLSADLAYWRDVHARIRGFLERLPRERQIQLHFERLVAEPERELGRLLQPLGLAPEPGMRRPREHAPEELRFGLGDESVRDRDSVDPSVARAWRAELSPEVLDPSTRILMTELGVEC